MSLKTGFPDKPTAIYQISQLSDQYLKALEYLKEYTNDRNQTQLDSFKIEYNSAINNLISVKNEYNDLVNLALHKIYNFNQ
ncbi:hypothetical protein [Paenibacillus wynnii]|uniref:Uncharacterized protein n=1 Tax=Paenibacillus wynnii TaxID=268407 RepID=A0A098MHN8_9BACL|nr:hypothetical protein [Paenibacillus wynnii]KGE21052.1 hypothetical protein PWYN_02535 [Paenibacillus wynnii]